MTNEFEFVLTCGRMFDHKILQEVVTSIYDVQVVKAMLLK